MKVMIEYDDGKIVWVHDVIRISEKDPSLVMELDKHQPCRIMSMKIMTMEIIPDA